MSSTEKKPEETARGGEEEVSPPPPDVLQDDEERPPTPQPEPSHHAEVALSFLNGIQKQMAVHIQKLLAKTYIPDKKNKKVRFHSQPYSTSVFYCSGVHFFHS
jgi:hypothetical protein